MGSEIQAPTLRDLGVTLHRPVYAQNTPPGTVHCTVHTHTHTHKAAKNTDSHVTRTEYAHYLND